MPLQHLNPISSDIETETMYYKDTYVTCFAPIELCVLWIHSSSSGRCIVISHTYTDRCCIENKRPCNFVMAMVKFSMKHCRYGTHWVYLIWRSSLSSSSLSPPSLLLSWLPLYRCRRRRCRHSLHDPNFMVKVKIESEIFTYFCMPWCNLFQNTDKSEIVPILTDLVFTVYSNGCNESEADLYDAVSLLYLLPLL